MISLVIAVLVVAAFLATLAGLVKYRDGQFGNALRYTSAALIALGAAVLLSLFFLEVLDFVLAVFVGVFVVFTIFAVSLVLWASGRGPL